MTLFVVTGLSGAGKTSLVKELLRVYKEELSLFKIVSYTTRPPRDNEVFADDYFFVSEEEFEKLVKEGFFIETSSYEGFFYGTPKLENFLSIGERNFIIVVDIKGAVALKNSFKDQAKAIFIGVPSLSDAEERLHVRGTESEEAIKFRTRHNLKDLDYALKHQDLFGLMLTNDDFATSLQTLYNYVRSEVFAAMK